MPGIGQVEGGLHPGDAAPDHDYGANLLFAAGYHGSTLLVQGTADHEVP